MSRTFKVTKSVSVDLTPDVAGPEKKLLVMAYSYFTSRKRVPGGMSKEDKEALKDKPHESEYRIDGVVATVGGLEKHVEMISGDKEIAKPWIWDNLDGGHNDREYIYSNKTSSNTQAVKWWKSRIAKAVASFAEFMASKEVRTSDVKVPVGTMRFPAAGYKDVNGHELTLAEIAEADGVPFFFEYVTTKPLSGAGAAKAKQA